MSDSLAAEFERRILDNRMMAIPASWANEIIFPCYDGLSIRNLAHTVVRLFEGKPSGARLGKAPLEPRLWEPYWGPTTRVVLFISDGLGWRLLQEIIAEDAETAQIVADLTGNGTLTPLTSVAPSTTATALPCMWTGAGAAGTGIVGTQVFLRELSMLVDLLHYRPLAGKHRNDVIEDWGMDFDTMMPATTVGEYLHAKRVPTYVVLQQSLFGSGLSRLMHRGVQHVVRHYGYTDLWITMRDVLRATRGGRCFVNIYWGAVDGISHLAGTVSESTITEVRRQLADLRDTLTAEGVADGRTLFMFTADHGHAPVPDYINLADTPGIKESLRCGMGGEGRFGYLYLRHDFRQQVIDVLEKDLKDSVTWILPGEALTAGLFGPDNLHPESAARLGDLSLIVREGFHIGDRPLRQGASASRHGGFSEREMLVPLLMRAL